MEVLFLLKKTKNQTKLENELKLLNMNKTTRYLC
ncbi:hypothetical protein SAMN05444360_12239 [Chryseobacterium carnipullorum]|uniref:Uncharacterized protein n=1 Tax=Chryseobacterium carnipullorum TaxID=1124835 RepID=A0A1M7MS50_CHRCU|nr:hypothetical protein SAMN05444360_12239 [Chryseobacterium carnipullorum]STC94228.1 Uncharacterised protein [Chryseobacterium carnipullorum]